MRAVPQRNTLRAIPRTRPGTAVEGLGVTRRQSTDDDATGKRLWLLIGPVVVLASAAVGWSALTAGKPPSYLLLGGLVLSIAVANRTVNRLLRGLRWQGERGFAILVGRWKTLRHTTASPRRTSDIVAAALHLTHFEYKYLPGPC